MYLHRLLIGIAALVITLAFPQTTHADENSPTMIVFGRDTYATPYYATWDGSSWSSTTTMTSVGKEPRWVVARDCPTRTEIAAAIMNDDGGVYFAAYTSGSWGTFTSVSSDSVNALYRSYDLAYEHISGTALLVYYKPGTGGDDNDGSLAYRTFNGSTLSSETTMSLPDDDGLAFLTLYPNPKSDEIMLIAGIDDEGVMATVWNGSSWSSWTTLSESDDTLTTEAFAFAYETQSNQGIAVFGDEDASTPRYRTWNGSSWSSAQNLPSVGASEKWIRLAADTASDEIICGILDASNDLNLIVWSGSGWGSVTEVETSVEYKDRRQFDIAYERNGNNALVAYHQSNENIFRYRTWNGAKWSAETNGVNMGGEDPEVIQLETGYGKSPIFLAMSDDDPDLELIQWSGSAMSAKTRINPGHFGGTLKSQAFMLSVPTQPNGSLVAHYKLDAASSQTVTDSSTLSNNGTLGGSSSTESVDPVRSCGVDGGALTFDGSNDYVAVPSSDSLKITHGLTIAAWIRGDSWGTGIDVNPIVRKGDGTPVNYQLCVKDGRLKLSLDQYDADNDNLSSTILQTDRWYHVAATWDGTNVHMYVDGSIDEQSPPYTHAGPLSTDDRSLYVGGRTCCDRFDGMLDDVRVYNYALDADDIAAIFAQRGNFNDVSDCSGYAVQTTSDKLYYGSGAQWGDLDNDGDLDAVITGNTAKLMINDGSGGFVSSTFGTGDARRQAALVDVDNDGDLDVWVATVGNWDSETLYTNNGSAVFTSASGAGFTDPRNNENIIAGDLDHDGWADVVILSGNNKNWIAHNDGASPIALTGTDESSYGLNDSGDYGNGDFASSGDVNNDGYLDFFYHLSGGKLFLSDGDGTYTENPGSISVITGNGVKTGSAWADFDNDGDLDLFVGRTDSTSQASYLWKNTAGSFTNVITTAGLSTTTGNRSGCWGDYDNDGDLDLYLVTFDDRDNALYSNDGDGTFTVVSGVSALAANGNAHDCVFVDYDNDGDLDISITQEDEGNSLLQNNLNNGNYLKVRLIGAGKGRTPVSANGVRVDLLAADGTTFIARRDLAVARGFGGSEPMWIHFGGITPATTYTLKVYWNDGAKTYPVIPQSASTTIGSKTIAQMITIQEPSGRLVMKSHGNNRATTRKGKMRTMRDAVGFVAPTKPVSDMSNLDQN